MGTPAGVEKFVKIGKTTDFQDGEKKKVVLEGVEIMVARVGAGFYALANRCPHMGGDLSAGRLDGTVITCPRHRSQFDVRDGKVIRWTNWPGPVRAASEVFKSSRPAKSYKVRVEGEDISIGL